jgi:hypothetical protein
MIGSGRYVKITAFFDRLTTIEGFDDREFSRSFLDHACDAVNIFGPFGSRHFFPAAFISIPRSLNCFVYIRRAGFGDH